MIPKELLIDVSELDPPKPFEEVVRVVLSMNDGEYIRMLHRKKPYPLIDILQKEGFECRIREGESTQWEIIIWNRQDALVSDYFR